MLSAIEVYNKPDFKYREETFSVLAINAWELLLKAKWLKENSNRVRSLYVLEVRMRADGSRFKHHKPKLTSSGNPFTHSLDYLSKKMVEKKLLAELARKNLEALCEIRDSSVHFYNKNNLFAVRLQEIGSAAAKNYVMTSHDWFSFDFSRYNFFLMPLAFINPKSSNSSVILNREEKNLVKFISDLEAANDPSSDYAVSVNIDLKFSKSKASDALNVQITNDPNATKIQLSEDNLRDTYPLNYAMLTQECKTRYLNFSVSKKYHELRKPLKDDIKYCHVKKLDPNNPRSAKQDWFSRAVFNVFDKHFSKTK